MLYMNVSFDGEMSSLKNVTDRKWGWCREAQAYNPDRGRSGRKQI